MPDDSYDNDPRIRVKRWMEHTYPDESNERFMQFYEVVNKMTAKECKLALEAIYADIPRATTITIRLNERDITIIRQ